MKNYKLRFSETDLKGQIKDLLAIKHIFSYPNLQGLGNYPGLPDRVLHVGGRVIYLEVKKPGQKLSLAQREFKEQCEFDRISYWVISSLEELEEQLQDYPKKQ